jgi:hypothetical protein
MSLSAIKSKVTSKVGRQILITQKHSPVLLFGIGVIGVGTTVVLACRATLKLEEVLGEAETIKEQIEDAKALESKEYTEEDAKKDGVVNRTKTALKIGKLYAPAAVVGCITVGAFTGSHMILARRNAAITAAYVAVDKGFKQYRKNVVGELGLEKDREFRFGMIERELAVDTDEGVAVKTVKAADGDALKNGDTAKIYGRFFDEYNMNWEKSRGKNAMFLRSCQNYANDLLNARGHVFLNEIYDMLGMERSKAGALVGWVKGNGDSYIDFGILDDLYMGQKFVNGDEPSIFLDFNVDGPIYDLI